MRRILLIGLSTVCLMGLWTTQAFSLVAVPESCESDADCQDGFECLMACTDDSQGSNCEGTCEPKDNKNECEADADCPTGFECIEHESWAPTTSSATEPDFAEPPCEGEDCEGGGEDKPGNSESPPEPTEPVEPPETVKTCAPKMCDTDGDCGGDLVCVLQTYDCPAQMIPDKAPMPDCPEGEDCGGEPTDEEPKDPQEPCEPETVGHCAPKWLAPCEADTDCGPGFSCVEEEMCWASSGGSSGSAGSPPPSIPCDPDDEDCGQEDSGDGEDSFAPGPDEGEGEGQAMPEEGCEPTGEFYCELQIIDCSTDACPEGLVCISADAGPQDDCAVSSDGEMSCPESDEEIPEKVCVPEGFEDWIGAGPGGQAMETSATQEPGAPNPEGSTSGAGGGDGGEDQAGGGSSSSSSDSGCAGGHTGTPLGTLVLSLMALALITRRRV